ncbi:MAG: hypothetical protein IJU19_05890 [Bacteroidales bacterium]|nr:hypothetical protein [Bacteroidales bacterium]
MNNRTLLRVLLVLTLCYAGLSAIAYLSMSVMQPLLAEGYSAYASHFPSEFYSVLEVLCNAPRSYFLLTSVCYLLEVVGAILMWRPRAAGFHCYAIARLLLILAPALFLGRAFIGLGDIMFALLYIALYYYLLRQLGIFGSKADASATPPDNLPQ